MPYTLIEGRANSRLLAWRCTRKREQLGPRKSEHVVWLEILEPLANLNPRCAARRKSRRLAHPTRFERVASTFGGWRSIQLSYGCISIWPSPTDLRGSTDSAFTNQSHIAVDGRLRPATRCSAPVLRKLLTRCLRENFSGFCGVRRITQATVFTNLSSVTQSRNTLDISLRRAALYPAELRVRCRSVAQSSGSGTAWSRFAPRVA